MGSSRSHPHAETPADGQLERPILRSHPAHRDLHPAMRRLLIAALTAAVLLAGCVRTAPPDVSSDGILAEAYAERRSGLQVTGEGEVIRLLSDDAEGGRHQRFVLRLDSGQTVLIAHNVDVAPRVTGLARGDRVAFCGVYEFNDEGGVVHWTHHDPDGQHEPGWLEHDGRVYR